MLADLIMKLVIQNETKPSSTRKTGLLKLFRLFALELMCIFCWNSVQCNCENVSLAKCKPERKEKKNLEKREAREREKEQEAVRELRDLCTLAKAREKVKARS